MTSASRSHITRRRVSQRGYTLVELMMAIAVFGIGVSGIIAMQKVAAAANQHSKALSVATNIAQSWIDALQADASIYNQVALPTQTAFFTGFTSKAVVDLDWFVPPESSARNISAAFDGLGNPLFGANSADAQFCAHLRLTQLYNNSPGLNVIRTQVRVFWPRGDSNVPTNFCAATGGMSPADVLINTSDFRFVYQVSAVRQQQ
jgi:prepilin-type N-terminal cleavage/methylation domain-containing protein